MIAVNMSTSDDMRNLSSSTSHTDIIQITNGISNISRCKATYWVNRTHARTLFYIRGTVPGIFAKFLQKCRVHYRVCRNPNEFMHRHRFESHSLSIESLDPALLHQIEVMSNNSLFPLMLPFLVYKSKDKIALGKDDQSIHDILSPDVNFRLVKIIKILYSSKISLIDVYLQSGQNSAISELCNELCSKVVMSYYLVKKKHDLVQSQHVQLKSIYQMMTNDSEVVAVEAPTIIDGKNVEQLIHSVLQFRMDTVAAIRRFCMDILEIAEKDIPTDDCYSNMYNYAQKMWTQKYGIHISLLDGQHRMSALYLILNTRGQELHTCLNRYDANSALLVGPEYEILQLKINSILELKTKSYRIMEAKTWYVFHDKSVPRNIYILWLTLPLLLLPFIMYFLQ